MDEKGREMNRFLVKVFNEILRTEESCLSGSEFADLSLREMHVIEAVRLGDGSGRNRASQIACQLGVTAGTLTTTVSLLEKKGYLIREADARDGRVKRIRLTARGEAADQAHQRFHEEMVRGILASLTAEEACAFLRGLDSVSRFFQNKVKKEGYEP